MSTALSRATNSPDPNPVADRLTCTLDWVCLVLLLAGKCESKHPFCAGRYPGSATPSSQGNGHPQAQAIGCRQDIETGGAVDLQEQDGSMVSHGLRIPLREGVLSPQELGDPQERGEWCGQGDNGSFTALPGTTVAPTLGKTTLDSGSCKQPAGAPSEAWDPAGELGRVIPPIYGLRQKRLRTTLSTSPPPRTKFPLPCKFPPNSFCPAQQLTYLVGRSQCHSDPDQTSGNTTFATLPPSVKPHT